VRGWQHDEAPNIIPTPLIQRDMIGAMSGETSKICKGNPALVGACYVIHGRATYGNGTPALRIWPVGTKRMLGVTSGQFADDAEDPIVPKNLRFDPSQRAYGDCEVCPFTVERPGHMQMVCVQSAKNLAVK
jgi:hypothetical protein